MNCIETKNNIEALLDGELDDDLKDTVEHHLWICPACCELKEQMRSVSNFMQMSRIIPPSAELDKRIMKSFQNHHASNSSWRRIIFGAFVVPKPIFAALLILATAGFWLAFQIGKINSTTVSITSPSIISNEIPIQTPAETRVQTVVVEVPVIKEKIVTRTIYVRDSKNIKNEKGKSSADSRQNNLPLYSSSVTDNGYFTDVSLKGFQPSAEISAKIIKGVKENEK